MAWISVHEQVLGGKLRSLSKQIGCSQNEALGLLVRLWLWGINNVGKDGLMVGANKDDIAEVLNVGIDGRYTAEQVIDAMIETEWIDFDDGLYIHDWEEWQSQWYKALEVRKRNTEYKREYRKQRRIGAIKSTTDSKQEVIIKNDSNEEKSAKKVDSVYPKDFEKFWEIYPRKVGKGDAYKKYKARLNDGWSEDQLLTAVQNYAAKCINERTESKYIKHGKTFLSESTPFIDYLGSSDISDGVKQQNTDESNPYGEWS